MKAGNLMNTVCNI